MKIPAEFVRTVLKGHSLLGLALAAAIYIVCLTGTIAVFAHEFRRWENATVAAATTSPDVIQKALEEAIARADSPVEHAYITLPGGDVPWLQIGVDAENGYGNWAVDAQGNIIESANSPWTEFLTLLHINLHLPRTWGIFIVGLTGVALLSSLISGLLAHPRIFRDAFHLRVGGSPQLQEADLHNRLGVWGLPFHVLVSLSGALLGLSTLIVGVLGMALFQGDVEQVYGLFQPPHPKDDPRQVEVIDLRPMFAHIPQISPTGRIDSVVLEHPTEMGGAALFNVKEESRLLAGTASFAFDRSGKLYNEEHPTANNVGEAILGALGPLHFGWFGGGGIKIAYALLGLGLTYLSAGGVIIWLVRRRAKGRPAPGWERLWTSVIWGQPLALATTAATVVLISRAGSVDVTNSVPVAVWGGLTVVTLAAAIWLQASTLSRLGRGITAAMLVIAAISHVILTGQHVLDSMAWIVNGCFIAIAALLAMTVIKSAAPKASTAVAETGQIVHR
ncbi:MAG: PepSY-associated TM helix domain-containing protein [Steroidobacter sp.]